MNKYNAAEIEIFMNYMLELRDLVVAHKSEKIKFFNETEYIDVKQKYLAYLNIWNEEHKQSYIMFNWKINKICRWPFEILELILQIT